MTKAKQFYLDYIREERHIIGGSVAIKKRIKNFRRPADIDVMVEESTLRRIIFRNLMDYEIKKSDYGDGIYSLLFSDDSKMDIICRNFNLINAELIDGFYFLKLDEIINHKIELIKMTLLNGKLEKNNKHIEDLIFISNNLF